ncbi:MAG: zinc-dependent metalloprotease [Calditrichia bacterium]
MKPIRTIIILLLGWALIASPLWAQSGQETEKDTTKVEEKAEGNSKKKKPKEPKFEELIEGFEKIEGLFTFYQNIEEGKVYMEIRQDHFGPVFLCNITRQSADAYLFDAGAMLGEFPFFVKRVGKKIQFIQKNVAFRAGENSAIQRAIESNLSNSIWGSAKIASQPHPELGSILVDASELFILDLAAVSHQTSQVKMPFNLDKDNSYFSEIKSFPQNSEIEVTLHFKSSKPSPLYTLPDSRSLFHRYHYSLSALPETDYTPRIADDRIGHFLAMYQDYSSLLTETPYKRYITRWHLKKSEPAFKKSKPEKPIVFWLENTIPVEFREAVRQGVLTWNQAFERIGFQDAIEVKQMPDDATWDPADVRYNTIRWIVQPGGGYAVGPSRANPFTGQIYDADIRISADMVRFVFREFDEFVNPLSWEEFSAHALFPGLEPNAAFPNENLPFTCDIARGASHQLAFGWNVLSARGLVKPLGEEVKKYINDFLIHVVAHEVGHTLGLRHNFKASSIYTPRELADGEFTRKNGLTGSMMDYTPVNLTAENKEKGQYWQTTLGPYDYWAIEYAYKPLDPDSKESEEAMLEKIASRVADPHLQYGTDEDAFGTSTRGIDPTCNLWDLGDDPIWFFKQRTQLSRELWKEIPEEFETKGQRYQKIRLVFSQGISEYARAAVTIPKFVGGLYFRRDHIGDPNGRLPFEVVSADKQREALAFLNKEIFAADAFNFPPELLNKLAPERFWDFQGTVFRITRMDYPIHGIVQLIQAAALFRLYDPLILQRIQDNELRVPKGEKPFTLVELFQSVRQAIWEEVAARKNINSFRRELQRMHLYILNRMVVNVPKNLPHDAVSLARADLLTLKKQIEEGLNSAAFDAYTRAHLEETKAKINAALTAQIQGSL